MWRSRARSRAFTDWPKLATLTSARHCLPAGVAAKLGANLVSGFSWMGRVGPLFAIYLTTTILTALLSNGASVTIVYPIAKAMVSARR